MHKEILKICYKGSMSELKDLTKRVVDFRNKRNWKKFHNPKDLAISLSLEASELLEHFQWKTADEENVKVLISITVDIAYKNPRVYQVTSAILSVLLGWLPKSERKIFVRKIFTKFSRLPNTGIMQLWLQRIILNTGINHQFNEILCRKVVDDSIKIWNSEWLNMKINKILDATVIIDSSVTEKISPIITREEVELFRLKEHSL